MQAAIIQSQTTHFKSFIEIKSSHQILCVLKTFSRPLFTSPYSACASLRGVIQLFWHFTLDLYQGFQQFTQNLDESSVCSKPVGGTLGVRASTTDHRKCPQRLLKWHFWIFVTLWDLAIWVMVGDALIHQHNNHCVKVSVVDVVVQSELRIPFSSV